VLWTISDGKLRKGTTNINSGVSFSSLAFAENTNRIWLTSLSSNSLYYVNTNSTQVNTVSSISGLLNGGDEIKIHPNGEIYFTTGTGIIRTNSSGSVISNYNSSTTNGMISGRPTVFDFDAEGNLWVLLSGKLYKVPIITSGNTKNYSFNADLTNLSSISVLTISGTDTDVLLAKSSGNAAIKIR
jgi:hypothetical protein